MDDLTPEQRRRTMQAVRSKDTSIEIALRKELWSRGIRYRKNLKGLPGTPDVVFKGAKLAVFCDSEFWHGFDWENMKNKIGTNKEFWINKIERNMQRDSDVNRELVGMGYTVMRFWGKDIMEDVVSCVDEIEEFVRPIKKQMISLKVLPENRAGCDNRITPYAEWDKSKNTNCIYCHKPADTREHVPSRVFLGDVLPPYIPTLPACSRCNNSFSADEEYVASSIDYIKSCSIPEYAMRKKTAARFERNKILWESIEKQFSPDIDGGTMTLSEEDVNKFVRIIEKLARGHAIYQNDHLEWSDIPPEVSFRFLFEFDLEGYNEFNSCPKMTMFPELGSRSFHKILFLTETQGDTPHHFWNILQSGHYRYLVYCDKTGTHVRIVIGEFLFCSVDLH